MAAADLVVEQSAAMPENIIEEDMRAPANRRGKRQVRKARRGELGGRREHREHLRGIIRNPESFGQLVPGVGEEERMHDGIRARGVCAQAAVHFRRQREDETRHDPDHPQRVVPRLADHARREFPRIAGQRDEFDAGIPRQRRVRLRRGQPRGMAGFHETLCEGDEGFDIAARAVGHQQDAHDFGIVLDHRPVRSLSGPDWPWAAATGY